MMDITSSEKANELHVLGRQAFDAGDDEGCIAYMRASAELEPHYKTMEILGESLLRAGRVVESIVCLAAAAGLSPKQARSRLLLAQALQARGDTRDARIQLEEALRVNPQYTAARTMLESLQPDEE
jgi:Flp pilus assembly protein TadD